MRFFNRELLNQPEPKQVFNILKTNSQATGIVRAGFNELVQGGFFDAFFFSSSLSCFHCFISSTEILDRHPGLEFLKQTPEFQDRYAETVIERIFYVLDRAGVNELTWKEFSKSNLLTILHKLDTEDDINQVLPFTSIFYM